MLTPSNSQPNAATAGSSRPNSPLHHPNRRRLRIVGSGTLFIAHTINVPSHPPLGASGTTNLRAQSVTRTRGGSVATILSILCQFNSIPALQVQASPALGPPRLRTDPGASHHHVARTPMGLQCIEAWLVAPIGRGSEASTILGDLEKEGVQTRLVAKREGEGVPSAYVIKSMKEENDPRQPLGPTHNGQGRDTTETGADRQSQPPRQKTTRTIINYNPIPDLTHEEFIRCLSPLLYPASSPSPSSPPVYPQRSPVDDNSPTLSQDPVFDWLHFEGRTAQTTMSNMTGLDGFARERGWRSKIVFSLDCTRPGRPGQEAVSRLIIMLGCSC